jgi:ABC-type siderophore export system fused ATPase/permease subunit
MKNNEQELEDQKQALDCMASDIENIILEPFSWMQIVLEIGIILTILSIYHFFSIKSLPVLFLIWLIISALGHYIRYKKSKKMIRKYLENNVSFDPS